MVGVVGEEEKDFFALAARKPRSLGLALKPTAADMSPARSAQH